MDPIAMPSIEGAIIWLRPAIIASIGSEASSSSSSLTAGLRPSDTASSVNNGRYASSACCAHAPGVVVNNS